MVKMLKTTSHSFHHEQPRHMAVIPGFSTLITSAPMSPRTIVQNGPARILKHLYGSMVNSELAVTNHYNQYNVKH